MEQTAIEKTRNTEKISNIRKSQKEQLQNVQLSEKLPQLKRKRTKMTMTVKVMMTSLNRLLLMMNQNWI